MTPFVVLTMWSAVALFLAVRMADPGEARFAWAPFAVVLGPVRATEASDRQKIAAVVESQQLR